jgi:hypothetical protein
MNPRPDIDYHQARILIVDDERHITGTPPSFDAPAPS